MRLKKAVLVLTLVAMSVAAGQRVSGADRSQAGPQASTVTVPARPTPAIPEANTGLAAKYPGDVGSEFADVLSLDGMEFEQAIARMTPAQRERFARVQ